MRPRPIGELSPAVARGLRGVFTDLDDTLSRSGRVDPEAFGALDRLRRAGLRVVILTGRPAGWVDHLARMWPVDGVVGENGGLWFWHDGVRLQRRFLQTEEERRANRARLVEVERAILRAVPGAAVSVDQPYRELDLAIDFCEDVQRLPEAAVDQIVAEFERAGATCKVSSIHVNGWFGDFDKLEGCRRFLRDRWGEELGLDQYLFCGDSGNDEPMFAAFSTTVGVANVAAFLPRLRALPTYITQGEGGLGFAEAVERVISARGLEAP